MNNFEKAFEEVQLLVQKFENGIEKYMSPNYSEAEARQHFIDNFFIALGWNVRSDGQHNPYEQEVKIELSQKQQNESSRKRADYAFYKAPNFKDVHFFVEAKKPAVLIQNNPIHYFQTIKYGWNATCPISVLTDFEELVIVDCRHKPDIRYALNGAHQKFRYTDYTNKEKFASIYYLLSKEAVHNNSIENYVSQLPKAKGKATQKTLFPGAYKEIDDDFLNYIDGIRENLAKAFKKNDETLDSEALTEATQRTVDRLVFIRFLEDKLIEPHNHISEYGIQGKSVWKDFIADCRALDAKYNGVVFKKHFIDDQDFVGAEDKAFADICADISNVNSPYHFNYIPIHILGSIYERFLGKVVIATDKRVRIEEKPEVRKAGGVYYTPKYIVDYIVENTIGKLIANKKPSEIAEMHFADIACGSGSFLIGVYDCLLKYHNDYYQTNTAQAKKDACEFRDGQYVLSLKQKQDILLNNIYGVDIDAQAVEVTQLSLFLKMLEDENVSTTQKQSSLFLKVLPDLTGNIKCGNSLIGTDILDGQLFNFEEEKALNPFDYTTAFAKVMKKGGFDAIVGNPPYVMLQNLENRFTFNYTSLNFASAKYKIDAYQLFLENGIRLLNHNGKIGYITPNTFLKNIHSEPLRNYILSNTNIKKLVLFYFSVFKGASVDTCIIILEKDKQEENNFEFFISNKTDEINFIRNISQSSFSSNEKLYFNVSLSEKNDILVDKLFENSFPLKEVCDAYFGIQTFDRTKFVSDINIDENYRPIIDGTNIEPYFLKEAIEYVNFIPKAIKSGGKEFIYLKNRICVRQIGKTPIATFVKSGIFTLNTIYNIYVRDNQKAELYFLLGIINSKLLKFYWVNKNYDHKETFPKVKKESLLNIPIKIINKENKAKHDKLVQLVEQMLQSKQQLQTEKIEKNKNYLEQKCTNLDKQIDNLVYELYDLTEDEIKIIENN
jgi:adenine-specific DNA-methyltransferase